jgi:hypothetical protein
MPLYDSAQMKVKLDELLRRYLSPDVSPQLARRPSSSPHRSKLY